MLWAAAFCLAELLLQEAAHAQSQGATLASSLFAAVGATCPDDALGSPCAAYKEAILAYEVAANRPQSPAAVRSFLHDLRDYYLKGNRPQLAYLASEVCVLQISK